MAHRYRLNPTTEQVPVLTLHCEHARKMWNVALTQANYYRPGLGPAPNAAERSRQLTEARQEFLWLRKGSSHVQKQALIDFDQAMQNWWGGSHGRPKFRRKFKHEGFCIRDVTIRRLNRKWATVHVPKLGRVKFRLSRPLPAEYGMGRVTLDRMGRWHVSFSAPQSPVERVPSGAVVGLDRGIAITVATSDGEELHCPQPTVGGRARENRLRRRMARRKKDSNRRERTRLAIAKLTGRQADRRKDWAEKTSTYLVKQYDVIVFEDLKVKNMMKSATGTVEKPGVNVAQKRGLNRSISEQGWSMLVRRVTEKAAVSDVQVFLVPAPGTSQTCHKCGFRSAENRRSQTVFECLNCGHKANADLNAAYNIRAAGLAVLALGRRREIIRADEPRTPREERSHAA